MIAASFTSCGKGEVKQYAASAPDAGEGGTNQSGGSIGSERTPAIDPGFGGNDEPEGGGEGLDGDDPINPIEFEPWIFRQFTDPRDSSVYEIVDGRVLITFKNPPQLPQLDPNYFDVIRPDTDPAYQVDYPPIVGDNEIDSFVAAENLIVLSEWKCIRSAAFKLPVGQSVEDAVANWPLEYPSLIDSVDPDSVAEGHAGPDDELWRHTFYEYLYDSTSYGIRIEQVWNNGWFGSPAVKIAFLDTGVQRDASFTDLNANMTSWGVNTGDDKSSCTWNIGNGAPWDWLLRESQDNARELGHGTCVAGIACAASNNDPDIYVPPPAYNPDQHLQVTDFCGITRSNMFIPFAMKARASGNSFKTSKCPIVNALLVLGCVKGRLSGTSASAPHVSAVAALMCSRFPTLTPSQVKARIENRGWTLPHSGPQPFLPCKGLDAYNSLLP